MVGLSAQGGWCGGINELVHTKCLAWCISKCWWLQVQEPSVLTILLHAVWARSVLYFSFLVEEGNFFEVIFIFMILFSSNTRSCGWFFFFYGCVITTYPNSPLEVSIKGIKNFWRKPLIGNGSEGSGRCGHWRNKHVTKSLLSGNWVRSVVAQKALAWEVIPASLSLSVVMLSGSNAWSTHLGHPTCGQPPPPTPAPPRCCFGWASPYGSYFDCKMHPSSTIRKHWRNKFHSSQVLEGSQYTWGHRTRSKVERETAQTWDSALFGVKGEVPRVSRVHSLLAKAGIWVQEGGHWSGQLPRSPRAF